MSYAVCIKLIQDDHLEFEDDHAEYVKARVMDDPKKDDLDKFILSKEWGVRVPGENPPLPVVGKPYYWCGMLTSPVVKFTSYHRCVEVQTEHSCYRFYATDGIEDLDRAIKSQYPNLPEMKELVPGCYYWGTDTREQTYKL